jgi:hypothetical protein
VVPKLRTPPGAEVRAPKDSPAGPELTTAPPRLARPAGLRYEHPKTGDPLTMHPPMVPNSPPRPTPPNVRTPKGHHHTPDTPPEARPSPPPRAVSPVPPIRWYVIPPQGSARAVQVDALLSGQSAGSRAPLRRSRAVRRASTSQHTMAALAKIAGIG